MHKQKVDQVEIENIFLKQSRRVVVTTRRRSLHVGCKLQHPITFSTYIAFKLCRRISFCQVHSAPPSRRTFATTALRYDGPQSYRAWIANLDDLKSSKTIIISQAESRRHYGCANAAAIHPCVVVSREQRWMFRTLCITPYRAFSDRRG